MLAHRLVQCAAAVGIVAALVMGADPLAPLPNSEWNESAVFHLLRRAAFGGTPSEVIRLTAMTSEEAVDYLVDYERLPEYEPILVLDPMLAKRGIPTAIESFDTGKKQRYWQAWRKADRLQLERIRAWWLERMAYSPRQLEEKMTMFWHGHFTSGYREVACSFLLLRQNKLLRDHAMGNFRTLAHRISRDPAMMLYLDSVRNRKRHPNENYARELLELFTLGQGHYTEGDIKEAARAFTGWSLKDGEFKFRPGQHDDGLKTFMGEEGRFDGDDIVDIVLRRPACHRYIVSRLWEFFCYKNPEMSVVDGLAATFRDSGYEIAPVVRRILLGRGFYGQRARGQVIKSPVHIAVATVRILGIAVFDPLSMSRSMTAMGQSLFQPPTVKGWDGGRSWITIATLFNRYNYAGALIYGERARRPKGQQMTMQIAADAFGFLPPPESLSHVVPVAPFELLRPQANTKVADAVDYLARRLLAVDLPAKARAVLIETLGGRDKMLNPRDEHDVRILRTAIHLLMSLPEYQVY